MIIGRELIRFATDVLCCKTSLQDLFRVSFIANCRSDNFWFKNKSSIVGFCGRIVVWCGVVDDKCFTKERKNEFRLANYNSLGEQKYRLKPQHMSSSSEQKQKFC